MTSTNPDDRSDAPKPEEAPEPQSKRGVQRTPEQWRDLISERIEEAMRAGHFDNLRGKGKPLNPAPEPHVPPEMQDVYKRQVQEVSKVLHDSLPHESDL